MRYIYKIIRITAWLLVIATGLTLLFGFLAYKPYITHHVGPDISTYLHNILLPLIFVPLFFIHSLCGTFIAIQRQKWINNKKVWQVGTSILWFGALAVIAALYFIQPPKIQNTNTKNPPTTQSPSSTGSSQLVLTLSEIEKHSSAQDCWMIIDNKVYNLTSYLSMHPAGPDSMTSYCGADGTQAFATKDRSRAKSHSSYANNLLDLYYIGDVGSNVDSQKIQNIQNQSSQPAEAYHESDDD